MLPQIVVKHVMDERATFRFGTQVDPKMLFDSSSFISRSYFDDSMGSLQSSPKVGVHDEEEEEEINALVVAALGDLHAPRRQ